MSFRSLLGPVHSAVLGAFEESDPAEYRVQDVGTAFPVRVIFDNQYVDVDAGEVAVESSGPAASTTLAELDQHGITPRHGDSLTISGTKYFVTNRRPDGAGWIVLILEED